MGEREPAERQSHTGAILGWGLLAIGTVGFIWFISTQLSVGYEDQEPKALEMVKSLQLPGMQHNLTDSTIEIGNAARAGGSFIGQFSWSSSQVQGPLYAVKLTWMEGSEHRRAEWKVDLEQSKIEPTGEEAVEFLKRAGATQGSG
jgi:hypothetical protein